MKTIRIALNRPLSSRSLDARLGPLACYLAAVAIVPTSVVALIRHPGSQADLIFGLALTGLLSLLLMSLGMLVGMFCRRNLGLREGISLRSRWTEIASFPACIALFVLGIRWLTGLGLSPAQVTLGLLMTCSLSLAVLVLGLTTSVVRLHEG